MNISAGIHGRLYFRDFSRCFVENIGEHLYSTRGCTGFDGLTEDGEAVRGREPRKKLDLNLNAEDNLALAA